MTDYEDPLEWVVIEHSRLNIVHRLDRASDDIRMEGTLRPLFLAQRSDDVHWCGECWTDDVDDFMHECPVEVDPVLIQALADTIEQIKKRWIRNE